MQPQLSFARGNGIDIHFGDPKDEIPGKNIILPTHPSLIKATDIDLDHMRRSLIKTALKTYNVDAPTEEDIRFLADETMKDTAWVKEVIGTIQNEGVSK